MKTNKTKKGPLGTPLGNPLGYFNSQKAKRNEPLQKARDGRIQQLNDMNPNYTMDPSNGAAVPRSFNRPVKEGPLSEATDNGGTTDPNKYVMNKTNVFGKLKHKEISKNKFDRVSKRYGKQEGSEQFGSSNSIGQQIISGKKPNNSVSREDQVRLAELEKFKNPGSSFKQGGTTKAAKFAALAKPFDKATAADRIAGANKKKNKRKK